VEIRANVSRVSTRPVVLLVALLCALAIGLAGFYTLGAKSAPTGSGSHSTVTFYQDRPGPDAPSRNQPQAPESSDPWAGHGH
jgi:hypothetical protein